MPFKEFDNYQGCWECDEFQTCQKFDFLKPIHKEANKNLRKIKRQGMDVFLEGKEIGKIILC
jgi:hypothetical protein